MEENTSAPAALTSAPVQDKPKRKQKYYPSKPLIEKRRRSRINEYLAELKLLIMDDLLEQPGRLSKLDKAELLDVAVKHLKNKTKSVPKETKPLDVYRAGFNECAWSVHQYLSTSAHANPDMRIRVLDHLATRLHHGAEHAVATPVGLTCRPIINENVLNNTSHTTTGQAFTYTNGHYLQPPNPVFSLGSSAHIPSNTMKERTVCGRNQSYNLPRFHPYITPRFPVQATQPTHTMNTIGNTLYANYGCNV